MFARVGGGEDTSAGKNLACCLSGRSILGRELTECALHPVGAGDLSFLYLGLALAAPMGLHGTGQSFCSPIPSPSPLTSSVLHQENTVIPE